MGFLRKYLFLLVLSFATLPVFAQHHALSFNFGEFISDSRIDNEFNLGFSYQYQSKNLLGLAISIQNYYSTYSDFEYDELDPFLITSTTELRNSIPTVQLGPSFCLDFDSSDDFIMIISPYLGYSWNTVKGTYSIYDNPPVNGVQKPTSINEIKKTTPFFICGGEISGHLIFSEKFTLGGALYCNTVDVSKGLNGLELNQELTIKFDNPTVSLGWNLTCSWRFIRGN